MVLRTALAVEDTRRFSGRQGHAAQPLTPHASKRGQILAVASRAECRQVTPCRVSSDSGGQKLGQIQILTLNSGLWVFVFVPRGTADNLCELNGAENTRFETRHRGRTRYGPPKSSFAPSRFRNSNIFRVSKPRRQYAQGRVEGAHPSRAMSAAMSEHIRSCYNAGIRDENTVPVE